MTTSPREPKVALVTGVAGQDGVYLSRLLLAKGYVVHGLERRAEPAADERLLRLLDHAPGRFVAHVGDLADAAAMAELIRTTRPHEVYNLAAQSSVSVSFDEREATLAINAEAPRRLTEILLNLPPPAQPRLFQASTSELFGHRHGGFADEETPFAPENPYAEAKLQAHRAIVAARQAGLHASIGILFNHESPLRGLSFVTRKITRAVAAIHHGLQERLALGDMDARRDWGHAREYVEAMWRMTQADEADDYVLATGVAASPRDFVEAAFDQIGVRLVWRGAGVDERGVCAATGRVLVEIDPRFFRPQSKHSPIGDASKARRKLGWAPEITWRELCAEMVAEDLRDPNRS